MSDAPEEIAKRLETETLGCSVESILKAAALIRQQAAEIERLRKSRNDVIEECAKAIEPLIARNSVDDDMVSVAVWDADTYSAEAIRAMKEPTT